MVLADLQDVRILVTGHTGFKGAWLSRILNLVGAEVHGISLPPELGSLFTRTREIRFESSEYLDINNRHEIERFVTNLKPDLIIHMAAQPLVRRSYRKPLETFETNVMGTAHVLNAALGCGSIRGVVAITTDKVYRNVEKLEGYHEDEPIGGDDPYSASKSASEMVIAAWRNLAKVTSGPVIVAARSGNVIGGGDHAEDRLIPDIMRSFSSEKFVGIRNPNSVRPWQHVIDPLFGYLLIATKLIKGDSISEAYNFGPGDRSKLSVADIVNIACQIWPKNKGWQHVPSVENMPEANLLWLSSVRSETELGWRNKLDAIEAIRWTVDWELMAREKDATFALDAQIHKYMELK